MEVKKQWFVPYNQNLLFIYKTYINVQICSCIKIIKYITNYVHKGHDRVRITIDYDECESYMDCGWIYDCQVSSFAHFLISSVEAIPRCI